MGRPVRGRWIAERFRRIASGAILALFGVSAVYCQDIPERGNDRPDSGRSDSRLPSAVTEAPDWIGAGAPFDVAAFFAALPPGRNAAPLYLDAFFEFDSGMAACFPAGSERDHRIQASEDRSNRYMELHGALEKDSKPVPAEAIDAVIKLYETGFGKLAQAQQRDRCVFEAGLGEEARIPHVQAARQVVRVASLRVRRAVERGDFDAAIRDVETVLRLDRDLRPRGSMITQMVAGAITEQEVCAKMVKAILAAPGLRVDHCDRLLKVFLNHDTTSSDGYAEGLRVEYLTARVSLRNPVGKQAKSIAQPSPAESSRLVRDLNDQYRALLGFDGLPYAERLEKLETVKFLGPVVVAFSRAMGRVTASLRGAECWCIMRRWHLTHRGLPRSLLVAAKEAGLKAIPADPFDGQPMRVAVVLGGPVVYSVGKDGHDDLAQADSKFDTQPGDLIFRMPLVDVRHEPSTSQ
jgi:hypothetical protein